MNATRRKEYHVDFVLWRSWYDIIDPVEKDLDTNNLSQLRDPGAEQEREEGEGMADGEGDADGVSDEAVERGGRGLSGGSRSTAFDPMLGKHKQTNTNARESSVRAVTGAMRDHTQALTRSDRDCTMRMRCEATRDIARQQADVQRELIEHNIAAHERIAGSYGERVGKGCLTLVDAIGLSPRCQGGAALLTSRLHQHLSRN
ncbi:hypothetical protein CBR_g32070 [Chara braunii]|uniref:Uncharacterized protein n=1 Tax=Chara braunii TaxID=69332 RepID=A0A388LGF9_CHABU|nr:hypothetical protein CBR_g32070 [Chara braunii]|eukprot:GBG81396.1 hypothetical protein CBR_g32070 [Chara braunii]